ncbi:MAG: aminopeptidase P family protein [Rhodobacteraceae bacterium]|nr:aminopeptidase P family protein [Paracoccaceae bacterium]
MFQSFDATTSPGTGPARLACLRDELEAESLDGFLVPGTDAHQGEHVAPADQRLAWLTGFTGSAGFCAALRRVAGVFIDGRYRVQVKTQVDLDHFTPVPWPDVSLADWLKAQLPEGGRIGFDPWLHTRSEMEAVENGLEGSGITMVACGNLVDRVWADRPPQPTHAMVPYPAVLAGRDAAAKRAEIAEALRDSGYSTLVMTRPDAIAWALNTRGSDLGQTPVALAFGFLHDDGCATLFIDPAKVTTELRTHLGNGVEIRDREAFGEGLDRLEGTVLADKTATPIWVEDRLRAAGVTVAFGIDPVALAKARKTPAEIAATTAAHIRDGAAMVEFLAWFADQAPDAGLTEIDLVKKLEGFRMASGDMVNISFDTIAGSGPNGAIVHYRVTEESNRTLVPGDLVVLDSGAQYQDGTTDITRTLAVGTPGTEERRIFTLVLKGMIALSRVRFPKGVAGRDLDALARYPLWLDGKDYNHGTGHGVGVFLGVHEGPQRLARTSSPALEPGMILSNEPGYYLEGAFGIRIENLIVVQKGKIPEGGDDRQWLDFRTLTFAPIERRLINPDMLDTGECAWIDNYHARVLENIGPGVSAAARVWLAGACAPLRPAA